MSSPTPSELNAIVCHPEIWDTVYLGADAGVFVSYDEGASWSPIDDGLPNAQVLQVLIDGNYLYAVTHGRGLWRRVIC